MTDFNRRWFRNGKTLLAIGAVFAVLSVLGRHDMPLFVLGASEAIIAMLIITTVQSRQLKVDRATRVQEAQLRRALPGLVPMPVPTPDTRVPVEDDATIDQLAHAAIQIRLLENGQDITDLVTRVYVRMRDGEVLKGRYEVAAGSGIKREVEFTVDRRA